MPEPLALWQIGHGKIAICFKGKFVAYIQIAKTRLEGYYRSNRHDARSVSPTFAHKQNQGSFVSGNINQRDLEEWSPIATVSSSELKLT